MRTYWEIDGIEEMPELNRNVDVDALMQRHDVDDFDPDDFPAPMEMDDPDDPGMKIGMTCIFVWK